ncbi:hypothetical protein PVK06_047032 [Gossypium arboreum]|uniref:Uncharacterized protein n=1 Tax=Gossypium arboreum TaxID=29729 RepID=A0ABR0MC97_GOSAR|nr:hypothetical protein PVK06_047032 [Gossypium arboreum]
MCFGKHDRVWWAHGHVRPSRGCVYPTLKLVIRQRVTRPIHTAMSLGHIGVYLSYTIVCLLSDSLKTNIDSESKEEREDQSGETLEESLISTRRVIVQESEVNAILPTSSNDNLELGTEELTRVVSEMLEKVFEARLEKSREMLQGRYVDCGKKEDRSPLRLES